MNIDHLLPLVGFAFATSVTPGPNNMMLLSSGANFGLRRTLPHMLGVSLGHGLMVLIMGLGLAGLITAVPAVLNILKGLALAYVLWLAWKIAHSAAPKSAEMGTNTGTNTGAVPFTFLQAAAFQWVNPKAIAMAISAVTAYAGDGTAASVAVVALVFVSVNLPSVSVWAAMGEGLRNWLQDPKRLAAFNWTMAGLLVASMIPVFTH